jgi:hypothetical protein
LRGRLLGAVRVLRSEREGLRERLLVVAFGLAAVGGLCLAVGAIRDDFGVLALVCSALVSLALVSFSAPTYRLFTLAGALMAFRALAALSLPDVAYGYVSTAYLAMFLTVLVRLLWLEDRRMLWLLPATLPLPGLN